jgi:NitT/TauT family transport system substrate-binding protein
VVTLQRTALEKPNMIRHFVQASAEGWKSYLANPAPGNALIKKANPQMEEELLAYGLRKMKDFGLVTGGDASTLGMLTMTDARWQQTFAFMSGAGLVAPETEYRKAYTLEFVKAVKVLP